MSTPHSPADRVRPLLRVRQVREFASTPVDPEALDAMADAARWSGSSRNGQPWRFVIVRDPDTVRAIHEVGLPQT
ncbi:MAG TPA: nitroreductase family protein, partial [Candidatus Limnocylindria bacterium]|nr:nitroreductase family protein [Candidatus Limnocylindria bacterium]